MHPVARRKTRHSVKANNRTVPIALEPLKAGYRIDPQERIFIEATERGDKHTVVRCLQGPRPVNVNCTDILGRSAIQVIQDCNIVCSMLFGKPWLSLQARSPRGNVAECPRQVKLFSNIDIIYTFLTWDRIGTCFRTLYPPPTSRNPGYAPISLCFVFLSLFCLFFVVSS